MSEILPNNINLDEKTILNNANLDELLNKNNNKIVSEIVNILKKKKTKKKVEKKIPRKGIDRDNFKFIIDLIDKNESNNIKKFNLKLLQCLLRYTGLRVNEVLTMSKHDISELLNKGEITIFCSKTKENRWVVLFEKQQKEFLKFMKCENKDELLDKIDTKGIVNSNLKRVNRQCAFKWSKVYFEKLENKIGGQNTKFKGSLIGLHSYRIQYINYMLSMGIHIDIVRELVGHKNNKTTLIYVRKQNPLKKNLKEQFKKCDFT